MSACDFYFGKVFAHLAGALAVSAASAEYSTAGDYLETGSKLLNFIVELGILLVLIWGIFTTAPGSPLKYVLFVTFAFYLGQVLKPLFKQLQAKDKLTRVLMMTTGVFVGMMAVGFYDKQNILGFGPYLMAGLVGLILARLLVAALGTPAEQKASNSFIDVIGVALFAVFTAYDVQVLKQGAKFCKMLNRRGIKPDYPRDSLGLYLDFINLFTHMGDLSSR